MATSGFDAKRALKNFRERKRKNEGKQVDNASLYAGSPMYYYCRACGELVAKLPEGWFGTPPPKYCEACVPLVELGEVK